MRRQHHAQIEPLDPKRLFLDRKMNLQEQLYGEVGIDSIAGPSEIGGTIHRAVARTGQNLDADTESTQDKSLSLRSQWAADLAEMRSECGASCACRRAKTGPVFVLPTPKK